MISAPFIRRPVATTLLTAALAISGIIAFRMLPVSPLPQVDFPTISVSSGLPGASPETMASSVATPLERQFAHISGVSEMTSSSSLGSTNIVLQFDLNRDINAAARDVQAAINAARGNLPANLPNNPTYRKVNPADAPVLILAMTSDTATQAQMYDLASSIFAQKLSQIPGVGQVSVGGSSLPAVRVELNPAAVSKYGLGLDQIATVLSNANALRPKGAIEDSRRAYEITTTDQLFKASQYMPLIVSYHNGAAIRLKDLGDVVDANEDVRNFGMANGKPSISVTIFRQPGANIIDTVDRIYAVMPQLQASLPPSMHLQAMVDRTTTIRASVRDVERTLLISIGLVVLVVFLFLRNAWATFIPSVSVPLSLLGTFSVMYLLGYTLDNLSLMALTISTGFVVDDAIVVVENISRYLEQGMRPVEAALRGSAEIGFTVLSMSTSLIAVFIPILLMGGIVGRLFREFAVTLSVAILVSLVISLTTTPMLSSRLLGHQTSHGRLYIWSEKFFDKIINTYAAMLRPVLRHPVLTLLIMVGTIGFTIYLYAAVPKGFFPQQDTGRMMGMVQARQNISFQAMKEKFITYVHAVMADPDVKNVVGFTGGGSLNRGNMFISLKDLGDGPDQRTAGVNEVIARIRRKTQNVPGAQLLMQPVQDIRIGGRSSGATYQFTMQSQDLPQLNYWAPRILAKLRTVPQLLDLNSDQQNNGLQAMVTIDRDTASRLGLSALDIDAALGDAFGQRPVSTMYTALNQYHVVMELAPKYWESPDALKMVYVHRSPASANGTNVGSGAAGTAGPNTTGSANSPSIGALYASTPSSTAGRTPATGASSPAVPGAGSIPPSPTPSLSTGSTGAGATIPINIGVQPLPATNPATTEVPLSAFTKFRPSNTPLSVAHEGQFPSSTISFNLAPNVALGDAEDIIHRAILDLGVPATVLTKFSGTAQAFQDSLKNEPVLIATALIAVYIVLGILYESMIHPITILSTLPSAGLGALLALLLFHTELSVIALIGIILLIGIVKKNAIMMIDFAMQAERNEGKGSREAIYEACLLRFRPIMMTTMAALLGAVPLAFGTGTGSELRRPLGITIIGGLIVSQMLTLFTTPVIYLEMDRLRLWLPKWRRKPVLAPAEGD